MQKFGDFIGDIRGQFIFINESPHFFGNILGYIDGFMVKIQVDHQTRFIRSAGDLMEKKILNPVEVCEFLNCCIMVGAEAKGKLENIRAFLEQLANE